MDRGEGASGLIESGTCKVRLKWVSVVSGALFDKKVFRIGRSDRSTDYPRNKDYAERQVAGEFAQARAEVNQVNPYEIPAIFGRAPITGDKLALLFEGIEEGKGELAEFLTSKSTRWDLGFVAGH